MRFIDCIDDIMLEMEGEEFAELAAIWGKDLDPLDPIKIVHMPEDNLVKVFLRIERDEPEFDEGYRDDPAEDNEDD